MHGKTRQAKSISGKSVSCKSFDRCAIQWEGEKHCALRLQCPLSSFPLSREGSIRCLSTLNTSEIVAIVAIVDKAWTLHEGSNHGQQMSASIGSMHQHLVH